MKIQQELDRFFNLIDGFKSTQTDLTQSNYEGFQKLFVDPYFQAFLKTSPLVVAIYNFPLQKYDFVSESISDICFLSPKDFMEEHGAKGFIEAMDEKSREAMIGTITPLLMQFCGKYASEIKNLRFSACVSVYKNEKVKKWALLHTYILEATPEGFPLLSCTLVHDVSEIKKDDLIYHSAKLLKGKEEIILVQDSLPGVMDELNLSKREIEVLKHICKGKTSKEIADDLFISFNTIKKHRNNILQKTGALNTPELINKATLMGLI